MTKVNPYLMDSIKKLGAFDVSACYSCGNCTAVCPLSLTGYEFPRKLIRYAMLGLEDKLISSPEIWLCYYCGECTKTCPREADPGGFMMALRRYVTKKYSWGRIGSIFYSNPIIAGMSWIILSIIAFIGIAAFVGLAPPYKIIDIPELGYPVLEFNGRALDFLHISGLGLGIFIGLSALANLFIMYHNLSKGLKSDSNPKKKIGISTCVKNFISTIIKEVAIQEKYWSCQNEFRYYGHMALLWGFTLLFISTLAGFGIDFYNLPISRLWPLIIGVLGGIILMYGSGYFIYKRIVKNEEFAEYSHNSDWIFVILLFLIGITGFLTTIFRFALNPYAWYASFVIHLILVFDLLITAPFTKFMHSLYRPLAIWMVESMKEAEKIPSKEEALVTA